MAPLPTAAFCVGLLALLPPSGEGVSIQRPGEPGEAAIAPAHIEFEVAQSEAESEAELSNFGPEAEPDPGLGPEVDPPWPADAVPEQVEPPPPSGVLPGWDSDPAPGESESESESWDQTRPQGPPLPKSGRLMFSLAGVAYGAALTRQLVTGLRCDDLYCGFRGFTDDALMLATIGFAAKGGWLAGRRAAVVGERRGDAARVPTGRRIAGWTLFAAGLSGLIVDVGLYNACYSSAAGPYAERSGFGYSCSAGTSAAVTDISGLVGAVGAGLGLSAEAQIKRARVGELSLLPYGGRGRVGVSLSGRF